MKSMVLLIAGLSVLTFSCTEEDFFEEEVNVRSLAKRNIQPRMEGIDPRATQPIESSRYSGTSISGECNVTVEWTHGYITGAGPYAELKASATSRLVNARNFSVHANWIGYYGINGTISYTYDETEQYYYEDGTSELITIPHRKSDSFSFSPNVCIITQDRLDDLLGNK